MKLPSLPHRYQGWRRTVLINTTLIIAALLLLVSFLIAAVKATGSVFKTALLFSGDCQKSSNINLGLHLFLNAISTCVLASSNYFQQVLVVTHLDPGTRFEHLTFGTVDDEVRDPVWGQLYA